MKKIILTLAAALMILTATQAQTMFHKQLKPLELTKGIVNGDYKLPAKKCGKHNEAKKHMEFKSDTAFMEKMVQIVRYNPDEFVNKEIEKEQEELNNILN